MSLQAAPSGSHGGTVACGHPETARAAIEILEDGGNAFDAALASLCAAFFAEPVLASLGGGGFLMAAEAGRAPVLYDFFCQTPTAPRVSDKLDFHPIHADFGTTTQEFHIGRAAVAVPGVPAGIFAIHADLCSLPLPRIIEPALRLAREGVTMNAFQADVFRIVAPIYQNTAATRCLYRPDCGTNRLPQSGETLRLPALGDTLQALAKHGEDYFYRGELAREIIAFCASGGLVSGGDLAAYRVQRRQPLQASYRGSRVHTNPLPSSGGTLICFGLKLLERLGGGPGVDAERLAQVLDMTGQVRHDIDFEDPFAGEARSLLGDVAIDQYIRTLQGRAQCPRGTTHISVVDTQGRLAALTVSNGEGCGELIGDRGLMLNNMLGEEDLNPRGFHRWRPDTRMTSMMAPTLLELPDGSRIALGSGGSNRIRSAILQVIVNRLALGMRLDAAISAPRMHLEGGLLSLEPGFPAAEVTDLCKRWPHHHCWDEQSLFFGGVHAVEFSASGARGAGDPRRGGVSCTARTRKTV